jgi:hypothetical protein
VSPFQLGAALGIVAGAIVALSARDTRLMLAGLVVALGLSPLLADPLPSPIAVAARLVAALLSAQLLFIGLRGSPARTRAADLGPLSTALAAAAACVVGYSTSGVGSPANGPALATAAGFGLATLAIGPLLLGRDVLRVGLGMILLVTAAELVRAGLAGTPGPLEQVASAAATVAILAATAALAASALASGQGLSVDGSAPRETLFEAHRLTAAAAGPASPAIRRPASGKRTTTPAAAPRRDAAAHQLTLEERLRFSSAAEAGASPEIAPTVEPETAPDAAAPDPVAPVADDPPK